MKIISYARSALPWAVIAAFLTPLVILQGLWYPAVAPKTFFLEMVGSIAVALCIFSAFGGGAFYYSRLCRWQSWLPAGLLAVEYLTSAIGIDFYRSFWGTMVRGDGLVMTTILVALFYIILLIADNAFWRKLLLTVSIVGTLSAVVGLVQWFCSIVGIALPAIVPGADRVGGLFGNAEFLASYLALSSMLTLVYAKLANRAQVWHVCAGVQFLVGILTATRGSILALAIAAPIALAYLSLRGQGTRQLYARIALSIFVAAVILGLALRGPLSRSSFEPLRRVASISLADPTVSSRLFIWNAVGAQAMKRPIQGVGAEHVTQLFDRIYDPTKIDEEWFDRSHNAYLDYFAQYGITGFALYVSLVTLLIVSAYKSWKPLLVLAGVIYAVQVFFVFDIQSTLLLFLTIYAMAISADEVAQSNSRHSLAFVIPGALIALAILSSLYFVVYKPLRANRDLVNGYLYQASDVGRSIQYFQNGLSLNTYADLEYGYEIEDMYVSTQSQLLKGQALQAAYGFAANTLIDDFKKFPYDARSALDIAQLLDVPPPGISQNLVGQVQAAARARDLSPLRGESWYLMVNADIAAAGMAANQRDALEYYQDAIGAMKEYSAKVPTLGRPKLVLAELYLTIGETASAKTYIKDLEQTDPKTLQSDPAFYQAIQKGGLL